MIKARLEDLGIVCSMGVDKQAVVEALLSVKKGESHLSSVNNFDIQNNYFQVGQVTSDLPSLLDFDEILRTRSNQLVYAAYLQIENSLKKLIKIIPSVRIAVIVGSSTSGTLEAEAARRIFSETGVMPDNFDYSMQEMHAPASFLAKVIGATGPVYGISTACSSSAKALCSGAALLDSGVADVVICGGVDSLCQLTLNGFKSLESTSKGQCKPFAKERDGINIGEAAALFVMSRDVEGSTGLEEKSIRLMGFGESSDAYHMSAPDPAGNGAYNAMIQALQMAEIKTEQLAYLNAHGTATLKNDEMEAKAIYKLVGDRVPVSSTKFLTGHTLGAAGALEAGICWLLLSRYNTKRELPASNITAEEVDSSLAPICLSKGGVSTLLQYCMSNSFAFGGNNTSLIFGIDS